MQQRLCLFRQFANTEHKVQETEESSIAIQVILPHQLVKKGQVKKIALCKKFHYFAKKIFLLFVAGSVQSKKVSLVILTFPTAISYCREQVPFRSLGSITSNLTFRKSPKYASFPDLCSLVCLENTTKRICFGKLTLLCVFY